MNIYSSFLPGIVKDISNPSSWLLLIVGLIILVIGIYLVYYYFRTKGVIEKLKENSKHLSTWSFKGFWGEYKGPIIIFIASLIIIISIFLIYYSLIGIDEFGKNIL